MEDEVFEEEYADHFSDVPTDAEDKEGNDSNGEEQIERGEVEDSFPQLIINHSVRILNSDDEESDEDPFPPPKKSRPRHRTSNSNDKDVNEGVTIGWSDIDRPRDNEAFEGDTGPRVSVSHCDSVEEVVNCFIGDDLLEFIAAETNKYYAQNHRKLKRGKKSGAWRDVTISQLKKFFGLVIIMGLVKKPRISDYWSTNPIIETPIFSKTMSRNRFREILMYLHFSDNEKMPPNAERLYKVQYILDYFSKKFEENFYPGQNISVDEGMIPWRGRPNFKVHSPNKITKYGLLVRMACDPETGYISSFKLYSSMGQTIDAEMCDTGKKDKNGIAILKPKRLIDYNRYMKGVDRADQYLRYYPIYRKTKKWTKKVLLYFINCAIFNSFCIYRHLNRESIRKLNYHDFLIKLGTAWIKAGNDSDPITPHVVRSNPVERLSGGIKHQLIKISEVKKGVRRDCRVCYANKIRKPTYFMCKLCKVPLHVGDCFNKYHTKEKY